MLSSFERRMWDEIQQHEDTGAEDPSYTRPPEADRRRRSGRDELPAVLVGGIWGAILLILFGAVVAGLAVATATAIGCLAWSARTRRRGPPEVPLDDRLPD